MISQSKFKIQNSKIPILQFSNSPVLQFSISPSLHLSNSPVVKLSRRLLFLVALFLLFPTCVSAKPLSVYVVNYPLQYFAERIGGEAVDVHFPAPADIDPAYWTPDILTIQAFQKADLILLNGAGYAKWIKKTSLPQSKIVDTSKKAKDKYILSDEVVTHSHGAAGAHAHESLAFTTWLDFDLAAKQAKRITEAFSRKRPELKETFNKNYILLEKDLMKIDGQIMEIVAQNQSQPLLASHPVYDYFARRYNLNLKSVHWEPDEIPTSEQWIELQGLLKEHPAKWMIWEGASLKESVEALQKLGISSLVFAPYGNVPDKGDFMTTMQENIKNLKSAYK